MINKKQLRELVAQVAEIKDLKPKTAPNVRLDDTDETEIVIDGEEVVLNKENNPTLGFELVKLKPVERVCELGCGKIVPNQKVEKKFYMTPKSHWRTRCDACGLWELPDKSGFVESRNCQNAYVVHFHQERQKAAEEKTKGKRHETIAFTEDGRTYTEITTNDSIIRKYK
jgi:hypothetical protein